MFVSKGRTNETAMQNKETLDTCQNFGRIVLL